MKNLALIVLMLTSPFAGKLIAQPHETGNKEKMKIFSGWVGHWKGEGTIQMGPGEPQKSTVDEHIESKLDGMVLLMEGVGKGLDAATQKEKVVHHALALLSFDQQSNTYKLRTYLNDGKSTEAWFNVVGENNYQWGFDVPQAKVRYNITIDPSKKTWHETGEYSANGSDWRKFLEMNLTKVD